jgi:hypothetical protein
MAPSRMNDEAHFWLRKGLRGLLPPPRPQRYCSRSQHSLYKEEVFPGNVLSPDRRESPKSLEPPKPREERGSLSRQQEVVPKWASGRRKGQLSHARRGLLGLRSSRGMRAVQETIYRGRVLD